MRLRKENIMKGKEVVPKEDKKTETEEQGGGLTRETKSSPCYGR